MAEIRQPENSGNATDKQYLRYKAQLPDNLSKSEEADAPLLDEESPSAIVHISSEARTLYEAEVAAQEAGQEKPDKRT
jgi:hypothetical protein